PTLCQALWSRVFAEFSVPYHYSAATDKEEEGSSHKKHKKTRKGSRERQGGAGKGKALLSSASSAFLCLFVLFVATVFFCSSLRCAVVLAGKGDASAGSGPYCTPTRPLRVQRSAGDAQPASNALPRPA